MHPIILYWAWLRLFRYPEVKKPPRIKLND
jgi:hypothetical protein